MSLRALESAITVEARLVFANQRLRVKDVQEWSTAPIKPEDGEVVERLPFNGVWVAIKSSDDKRAKATGSTA